MSRISIVIFGALCALSWLKAELIGEISLKKDEVQNLQIFVDGALKSLSFRWTLYKDSALITHFKYDEIPQQFTLYPKPHNAAKVQLSAVNSAHSENPYMIFYFVDFNMDAKEAKFRYYLFKFNNNIEVVALGRAS